MNICTPTSHVKSSPFGEWYLVQCKSGQDYRAEENLIRQGFVCARPVCQRDRVLRGRREVIQESLFPGYLFINLPIGGSWSSVRSTRGVVRIVSFGGTPLSVNSNLVAQLQAQATPSQCNSFSSGDRVKLLDEGFAELEAVFLTMDGDERAILLINFLNRQQQVSLPLAKISAL